MKISFGTSSIGYIEDNYVKFSWKVIRRKFILGFKYRGVIGERQKLVCKILKQWGEMLE